MWCGRWMPLRDRAKYWKRCGEDGRLLPQTIPHPIAMRLRKGGAPGVGGGSCDGRGAKFGLLGSISTEEGCVAAGGTFQPNLFGGWCMFIRSRRIGRRSGRWIGMMMGI